MVCALLEARNPQVLIMRLELGSLGPSRESEWEFPENLGIGPGFPTATVGRILSLVARARNHRFAAPHLPSGPHLACLNS